MSDEVPFWKREKALSLERKKAARAIAGGVNPGDAFLIITEGKVTEPVYFELVCAALQLPLVRIRIEQGAHPDPRHVIETAAREVAEHARRARKKLLSNTEPPKFDHVWAVVDTDVAVRQGFWAEVESLASARNVKLAHSTPCFEYWLLLHIQGLTTRGDLVDGDSAKKAVATALGEDYSTNEHCAREVFPKFIGEWWKAVQHGEQVLKYHREAGTKPPADPSTTVCVLVRALDASAPPPNRKLS